MSGQESPSRSEPDLAGAWRIVNVGDVGSTQAEAKRLLATGPGFDGVVLRATSQTAGLGRRGGNWRSGPGGSYQTFVVPAAWLPNGAAGLTLAIGVELAERFRAAGARCEVKWPNDLYYLDRKLGGVLVEGVRDHFLVGVGVNVTNEVPDSATALRGWDVPAVSDLVIEAVTAAVHAVGANEVPVPETMRARFAALDWLAGKLVTVSDVGDGARVDSVSGVAAGIDALGRLVLESPDTGERTAVGSGTVSGVERRG